MSDDDPTDLERARADRLIRRLCNRAPESPGCLWPACDCGVPVSPDDESGRPPLDPLALAMCSR